MVDRATKRTVARVLAALVFLTLAGATYQGVATALERRSFPRPGGMVSVGDHQLHIYCTGDGAPIVVLEAPAAGMSAVWGTVQPRVAAITRVCSYDRAGLGWSERGDVSYQPARVADELHTLLGQAGEHGPYVLAGHGLGAAFGRLFAARFPIDSAVLVVVDEPVAAPAPARPEVLMRYPAALPWLARTGLLRATGGLCAMADGIPEPSRGAICALLNRPDHLSRTAEELSQWQATMTLAAEAQVATATTIARVDVFGAGRVGFLPAAAAAPVVMAIEDAVRQVRARANPSATDATLGEP